MSRRVYMQVFATSKIEKDSVVWGDGSLNLEHQVPIVAAGMRRFVLGVADAPISVGEMGTIVVAGVVTLYAAQFGPSALPTTVAGAMVYADDFAEPHITSALSPLGTLIAVNVPGKTDVMTGKYVPGGSVFLCPWMRAFQVPRVVAISKKSSPPTKVVTQKKFETKGGMNGTTEIVTTTTTNTTTHTVENGTLQVDFKKLFGPRGFTAFKKSLGWTEDTQSKAKSTTENVERLQKAVHVAITCATCTKKPDASDRPECLMQ